MRVYARSALQLSGALVGVTIGTTARLLDRAAATIWARL